MPLMARGDSGCFYGQLKQVVIDPHMHQDACGVTEGDGLRPF